MNKKIIIAAALLSMASAPVMAASMGHQGGLHAIVKQTDANHDGKITKSEFLAAATRKAEKHFRQIDANGDGVLDKQDHMARFDHMDADHNGKISRQEWQAFHEKMKKDHHGKRGMNNG